MGGYPNFYRLSTVPLSNTSDECEISILTTLASPVIEAINEIRINDKLLLSFDEETGALVAKSDSGVKCGSIVTAISLIRNCIEKGSVFEARVVNRDRAECQVLITKSIN